MLMWQIQQQKKQKKPEFLISDFSVINYWSENNNVIRVSFYKTAFV